MSRTDLTDLTSLAAPLSGAPAPSGRDRSCAQRLLLTERDAVIPLLRNAPPAWFRQPTACSGWSVRDVLAHCAAALTRIAENRVHDFSPERNQQDVHDRRDVPIRGLIDELEVGYTCAGPAITAAEGRLDVIALGEWVHAGDFRAAFGMSPAYATEGTDEALLLLADVSRIRNTPLLTATLPQGDLQLGTRLPHQHERARLSTDAETLVRLYTGRPVAEGRYELVGAAPADLVIYR